MLSFFSQNPVFRPKPHNAREFLQTPRGFCPYLDAYGVLGYPSRQKVDPFWIHFLAEPPSLVEKDPFLTPDFSNFKKLENKNPGPCQNDQILIQTLIKKITTQPGDLRQK